MRSQTQYRLLGRSPFLLKTHIATRNGASTKKGRAITTHSFGLHKCNKPKGVQTLRSIPNATTHNPFQYIKVTIVLIALIFQINKNKAQTIPSELDTCYHYTSIEEARVNKENVQVLDLSKSKLKTFPKAILEFKNLKYLDLSKNKLTELPDEIGGLTQLQVLVLHKNNLTYLPDSIVKLQQLEKIYLSANSLTSFPLSLLELNKLKVLVLNRNQINFLPYAIQQLQNLEYLDLWENNIEELPASLNNMPKLKEVDLRLNPMSNSKKQGLEHKYPSIKFYFSNSCNCGY